MSLDKDRVLASIQKTSEEAALNAKTPRERAIALFKASIASNFIQTYHDVLRGHQIDGVPPGQAEATALQEVSCAFAQAEAVALPAIWPMKPGELIKFAEDMGGIHKLVITESIKEAMKDITQKRPEMLAAIKDVFDTVSAKKSATVN